MGADISIVAEVRKDGRWEKAPPKMFTTEAGEAEFHGEKIDYPFWWRSYEMYGVLADHRCHENQPFIRACDEWPLDAGDYEELKSGAYAWSWATLKELLAFDYDQEFVKRDGTTTTVREFLPKHFFVNLEELKALGEPEDVRILFHFDN